MNTKPHINGEMTMTNVMIYRIERRIEGIRAPNFIAYVVLPDGSLWGVRFEGDSEEQARSNAITFYEAEKAKQLRIHGTSDVDQPKQINAPMVNFGGRGAHLVGTVCMINHGLKQRIRCKAAEVPEFEAKGWVKGGPRTPFNN